MDKKSQQVIRRTIPLRNPKLMQALDFTQTDIAANRRSRITPQQRDKLARLRLLSLSSPAFLGFCVLCICYLIWTESRAPWIVAAGVSIILLALVAAFTVYRWQRITRDIRKRDIVTAMGKPTLWATYVRGVGYVGSSYLISVDGQTFLLPEDACQFIHERQIYRFFLTRRAKIILSVESFSLAKFYIPRAAKTKRATSLPVRAPRQHPLNPHGRVYSGQE